jgi:hypothetical protein
LTGPYDVREIRKDIEKIKKAYKTPDKKTEKNLIDDNDGGHAAPLPHEADMVASRLMKFSPKNQILRAQGLLTPEAVGALIF